MNSKPSRWVVSLRLGSRPNAFSTSPPMVSNSSSLKVEPKASLKSSIGVNACTKNVDSVSFLICTSSSASVSSSISPTISSKTSSMVTSPATPPYSSITIAMWLRCCRNSLSSTLSRLLSGTITAARIKAAISKLPSGSRAKGRRSFANKIPLTSSVLSPTTG